MEDSGIDSDPKNLTLNRDDSLMQGNLSDSSSSSINVHEYSQSNVKQLQRKLEQRIQEAKKIQKTQQQQDQKKSNFGPNLIPIQRLSIPNKPVNISNEEHVPLVEWDVDDSDETVHFFPSKMLVKQELTDTFSIEEVQVSLDEDDEDDLNLLPPKPTYQRISFCCFTVNSKCAIQ